MSVEQNLIFARFGEHMRALLTMVNANMERKDTLTKVMVKIWELF